MRKQWSKSNLQDLVNTKYVLYLWTDKVLQSSKSKAQSDDQKRQRYFIPNRPNKIYPSGMKLQRTNSWRNQEQSKNQYKIILAPVTNWHFRHRHCLQNKTWTTFFVVIYQKYNPVKRFWTQIYSYHFQTYISYQYCQ